MAIERTTASPPRRWHLSPDALYVAHERAYRRAGEHDLALIAATLQASPSELGQLFGGISRQAVGKWMHGGIPSTRLAEVGRIADITRRLRRTFKRERIPAIVRQPNPGLGGHSVLRALAEPGGAARVAAALDRLTSYVPSP
ncbi:MAG TPA: hypothetical protein VFB22_14650 [Candidatus Baltobacteraceae bacterium]|nr:hypothetical protein [Candidatus Baltobacteraceae bacterium]